MYTAKQKNDWIHTTHQIVTLLNCNRAPNTQPISFEEVYPFAPKRKQSAGLISDPEVQKLLRTAGGRGA
jgi:hypothetical protein